MKLQDYAQYYIGCRCLDTWFPEGHEHYNNNWILTGYVQDMEKSYCLENKLNNTWTDLIKLILRKINDITEDEFVHAIKLFDPEESVDEIIKNYRPFTILGMEGMVIERGQFQDAMQVVHYLISIGIDMFGLIDAGLAIDSKILK